MICHHGRQLDAFLERSHEERRPLGGDVQRAKHTVPQGVLCERVFGVAVFETAYHPGHARLESLARRVQHPVGVVSRSYRPQHLSRSQKPTQPRVRFDLNKGQP